MRYRILLLCLLGMTVASGLHAQRPTKDKEKARQWQSMENGPLGLRTGLVLLPAAQEILGCRNVLEVGRIPIRLPGALQGAQVQRETHHAHPGNSGRDPAAEN